MYQFINICHLPSIICHRGQAERQYLVWRKIEDAVHISTLWPVSFFFYFSSLLLQAYQIFIFHLALSELDVLSLVHVAVLLPGLKTIYILKTRYRNVQFSRGVAVIRHMSSAIPKWWPVGWIWQMSGPLWSETYWWVLFYFTALALCRPFSLYIHVANCWICSQVGISTHWSPLKRNYGGPVVFLLFC